MEIVIDIPDRLIKKVKDHYVNPYEVDEICEAILVGIPLPKKHGRLIDADENMSSVTPQQKMGKWIEDNEYFTHCNQCNMKIITAQNWFKFCPNCGADMREGAEEK